MKLLKKVALSLVVIGAAHAATLSYSSSAMSNTEAGNLLFAPDIPIIDPAVDYLMQTDFEPDVAFGRGLFPREDEESGDSGDRTTELEYIGFGPLGVRGIFVPDISIDSLVPVSGNLSKSTAAVLAASAELGGPALTGMATEVSSSSENSSPDPNAASGTTAADVIVQKDLDVAVAEMPEPATWALLTGGLVLLALGRLNSAKR